MAPKALRSLQSLNSYFEYYLIANEMSTIRTSLSMSLTFVRYQRNVSHIDIAGWTGYPFHMTHSTIDVDRLYQRIGKAIHDLRQAKKPRLTQAGLAELLGVTRTSITNIEKGEQRIPLHLLYMLCAKLSVQISDVIPVVEDVVAQLPDTTSRRPDQSTKIPPKTAALMKNLSMGDNE